MFLIHVSSPIEQLLFLDTDPRHDGYTGEVKEGVTLEEMVSHDFSDGGDSPVHYLGVSRDNGALYRVFESVDGCKAAGFRVIPTGYSSAYASYSDFINRQGA